MSIQSEITRIQNSVSGQSDLLDMIIAALAGKAAGGGGNTIYVGSEVPTNDVGNDGDIYIVR